MVSKRFSRQLIVGWVSGTIVTVLGMFFSVELDLSPGPTVVAFYGLILAVLAVGIYIFRATDKIKALKFTSIGCGMVAIIACVIYFEGRWLAGFSNEYQHEHQRVLRLKADREAPNRTDMHKRAAAEEPPPDTAKLEAATRGCVGPGKIERYVALPDSLARLEFIQSKFDKGEKKALGFLFIFLSDPDASEFYRTEGVSMLSKITGSDFGYRAELDPEQNRKALDNICRHLQVLKRTENASLVNDGGG